LTNDTTYGTITFERVIEIPSVEKIIEKMKNQPRGIRLEEAEKVLSAYGYSFARQRGSHRYYINNQGDLIMLKEPLKISYITELLERIGER